MRRGQSSCEGGQGRLISSNTCTAHFHCRPFAHAPMSELHATTFGCNSSWLKGIEMRCPRFVDPDFANSAPPFLGLFFFPMFPRFSFVLFFCGCSSFYPSFFFCVPFFAFLLMMFLNLVFGIFREAAGGEGGRGGCSKHVSKNGKWPRDGSPSFGP